jgi:hypothetical protein
VLAVQTVIPKYLNYKETQDSIETIVRLILAFALVCACSYALFSENGSHRRLEFALASPTDLDLPQKSQDTWMTNGIPF